MTKSKSIETDLEVALAKAEKRMLAMVKRQGWDLDEYMATMKILVKRYDAKIIGANPKDSLHTFIPFARVMIERHGRVTS